MIESTHYQPAEVEPGVYELWTRSGAFRAIPDARPRERRYVIMMPLPNVTGALHMGHAMDNVMQDLLIRWHRMMGDNTLWMPGTDHAGIATQAVVEKQLKEIENKTRHDIGRDALVERIWATKGRNEQRIVAQQQAMGCSCDWERHRFTMDEVCARAVRHCFFRLFDDGLICRGKRLVNWDVMLQTSISDDEVYHETVKGSFWHLAYPVIDPKPGEPDHVIVATTRPETMLGDTAVAVHPDPAAALDARLAETRLALEAASKKDRASVAETVAALERRRTDVLPLLEKLRDMARDGRHVLLPLLDRPIPLICDEWAKPELGSGCVKITPAHDPNDYDVWSRHKDHIGMINVLNPDGTLNAQAGPYAGLDRDVARTRVVADLEKAGLVPLVEDRETEIGHSDRSKTAIEPYLSDQWYVRMGDVDGGIEMGRGTPKAHLSPGLVQAAMDAVTSGRVAIHPERYTKTYLDWLAEKRDWPISRQLWWGHQIPVWSRPCTWSTIDLAALAQVFDAAGRASVRLVLPEQGTSLRLTGPALPDTAGLHPAATVPAGEPCKLDVCLLHDGDALARVLESAGFARDPDVLDTWFSSALWPFSTLGWPDPATAAVGPGRPLLGAVGDAPDALEYYYPGSCLVTGRDIITLWVARMVLAGLYCLGDVPFSDVFIHANILDGKGERMSKSKGNGIDPVDIIESYGTDAMRYVLCDMQTGSQDIRLPVIAICPHEGCGHHNDLAKTPSGQTIFVRVCNECGREFDVLGALPGYERGKLSSDRFEDGRRFCNKLWNSARFVFMNIDGETLGEGDEIAWSDLALEDRFVLGGLNEAIRTVHGALLDYNPSTAINAARELFWSSLCDWYLELARPRLSGADAASARLSRSVLAYCLDQVLRLLHPFVPFVTEHLWQRLAEMVPSRGIGTLARLESSPQIIAARWPEPRPDFDDEEARLAFRTLQRITRAVREVRSTQGIQERQPLAVTLRPPPDRAAALVQGGYVVRNLAYVDDLRVDPGSSRAPKAAVRVAEDVEIFVHDTIDDATELGRLLADQKRVEKEIETCRKKLANPSFVDRARPEAVEEQRARLSRYESQASTLVRILAQLR